MRKADTFTCSVTQPVQMRSIKTCFLFSCCKRCISIASQFIFCLSSQLSLSFYPADLKSRPNHNPHCSKRIQYKMTGSGPYLAFISPSPPTLCPPPSAWSFQTAAPWGRGPLGPRRTKVFLSGFPFRGLAATVKVHQVTVSD